MSNFVVYSPYRKEVYEVVNFSNALKAGEYVFDNYNPDKTKFVVEDSFKVEEVLADQDHDKVKRNDRGKKVALVEDGHVYHCGKVTLHELEEVKRANLQPVQVSKLEWVQMHNNLVRYDQMSTKFDANK